MKRKPYSEYKDSGIEWLGKVPEHWEVKRLKNSVELERNGIWGNEPKNDENDLVCVRVADFERHNFTVKLEEPTKRNITPSEQKERLLEKGDLLLEKSGGGEKQPVGCVVLFGHKGQCVCSNFVARLKTSSQSDSRFFVYVHAMLYAARVNLRSIKQNTGIQNLDSRSYFENSVAFPLLEEQKQIADFLDRETARVDDLIAKQNRMIELLAEKRNTLISHAVTRGLDSQVTLKASGVEWLGEVPKHWEVKRLDFLATVKARVGWKNLTAAEYVDEGFIFLATPNIKGDKEIDMVNVNYITPERYFESPEIMLQTGDVLLAKDGSTLGIANIVRELSSPATVNGSIAVLRPKQSLDSSYFLRWICGSFIQAIIQSKKDGQGVPHLFQADIKKFPVLLPPLPEQKQIAEYLDEQTAKIDALTDKAREAIVLMKEHRSALIASAVTGKIDVRTS